MRDSSLSHTLLCPLSSHPLSRFTHRLKPPAPVPISHAASALTPSLPPSVEQLLLWTETVAVAIETDGRTAILTADQSRLLMCVCGSGMKGVGRREAAETGKRGLVRQEETRMETSKAALSMDSDGWQMELEWVENDLGTGRQVLGADQYVRYEGGGRDLDGNFQSGAEQGLETGAAGKVGTGTRSGSSRDNSTLRRRVE